MIQRTIFKKEIITEFILAPEKTEDTIIFLTGIPSSPNKNDLLEFYAKKGFNVFLPRYRGTWESKGEFLKNEPTKDIIDVIEGIQKPFIDLWTGQKFHIENPNIYILGAGFGGTAGLYVSKHKDVKYVFLNSPVIDWSVNSKIEPLKKLEKYLIEAFPNAFRFKKENFKKLQNGKFYNPINNLNKIDWSKVTIFHAKDDEIVSVNPLLKIKDKTKNIRISNNGGHFGCNDFMRPRWSIFIMSFIKGKKLKNW